MDSIWMERAVRCVIRSILDVSSVMMLLLVCSVGEGSIWMAAVSVSHVRWRDVKFVKRHLLQLVRLVMGSIICLRPMSVRYAGLLYRIVSPVPAALTAYVVIPVTTSMGLTA